MRFVPLFAALVAAALPLSTAQAEAEEPDVVIVGGTPGGIAAALSSARLGHTVALIEYYDHLGGMSASGLGKSDIETAGAIGGIWDEFVGRVYDYYVGEYGADSPQVKAGRQGYFYEPSVAEAIFNEMLAEEDGIDIYLRHRLDEVVRNGDRVTAIRVANRDTKKMVEFRGRVFLDCTYEGDLAAYAGVPYRLGREARDEHNEAHAGVIYMDHTTRALLPGTTGQGDDRLVAYTYRLCFSSDPDNMVYPEKPVDYDRSRYEHYFLDLELGRIDSMVKAFSIAPIPNEKYDVNMKPWPLGFPFAEENEGYPEGSWEEREAIMAKIRNITLGLMWFLQNDPEVPEADREEARRYGLAKDEFTDNNNFPFQFYVREARRPVGAYTLTENDLTNAPESLRAPVHADAVSCGEFPIDSFPTRKYEPGHEDALEGYILMLGRYTQPYQIPYRVMVPQHVNGLLMPVPVSATHIAFSSVRLEPTWVSLGQAAGVAAHLAMTNDIELREVPVETMQRMLLAQNQVLSYFRDVPKDHEQFAGLQFWGTKGFFDSYEARPDEPLDTATFTRWHRIVAEAMGDTAELSRPETPEAVTGKEFVNVLTELAARHNIRWSAAGSGEAITRADACTLYYTLFEAWQEEPDNV